MKEWAVDVMFWIAAVTAVVGFVRLLWIPFARYIKRTDSKFEKQEERLKSLEDRIKSMEQIQTDAIRVRQEILIDTKEQQKRINELEKFKERTETAIVFRQKEMDRVHENQSDLFEMFKDMNNQMSKFKP